MTKLSRRRALIIFGMHRSGTSALSRVLSMRGAELPAHLLAANDGNPSGYWEPAPIVDLNDEILDHFGLDWDDPFAAFRLPAPADFPERFQVRAQELLASEFGDAGLFVLKDPRITLLHGFWLQALARAGIEACPVAILRPGAEVAASLHAREGMTPGSALLLYSAYSVEIARAVEGRPTAFVTFAQLRTDWRQATDRIAAVHHFKWPRSSRSSAAQVAQFLHDRVAPALEMPTGGTLPAWPTAAWKWFEAAANGAPANPAEMQFIRERLAELAACAAPAFAERRRKLRSVEAALAATREAQRQQGDALQLALENVATLAGERDGLREERQQQRSFLDAAEAALAELDATSKRVQQDAATLKAHLARQDDELDALRRQQAQAQAEAAELVARIAGLQLEKENHAAEHEAFGRERVQWQEERQREIEQWQQEREQWQQERQQEREQGQQERDQWQQERRQEREQWQQERQQERDQGQQEREQWQQEREQWQRAQVQAQQERDVVDRAARAEQSETQAHLGVLQERVRQLRADVRTLLAEKLELGRSLVREGEKSQRTAVELAATEARLAERQLELDQLRRTRQTMSAEIERRNAALAVARNQAIRAQETVAEMLASRSWRLTSPMRGLRRAGDRLLALTGRPPPASAAHLPRRLQRLPATGDSSGDPAPSYEQRGHPGLGAFLQAEFGESATAEVLARIDRYRLPVDTTPLRGAASADCSIEEARQWAVAIARLAASRADDEDAAPDVTIVIPAYNQVAFTLACVESLFAHQSRYRFEILVGDDASTDATAEAFKTPIAGLSHVRHRQNLGFLRNCNATASRARGRYLVLLNNDTQVLPGWLDELLDVLVANASVGLVGSKLVFPDGRLQECGGIVWRDGSAHNVGRGEDPRRPEFCYLRGTDFVSGASIALPTAIWRQLDGFDELFAPAYAEDVDLAFRVRAAGLYTLVQPLSQMLHFEGVSSGTDPQQGAKAHQVANLEKIHQRWAGVLAHHRVNAEHPELERERDTARRMLFVDNCTLTPNEDAGSLVALEIIKSFRRQGFKVTFIPEDNFAHMGEDTRFLQRLGVEAIYHPTYSRMSDFLAARSDPFDVILLHRFSVGDKHLAALRAKYPQAKVVFLICDLHYLRQAREAELSQDPTQASQALETKRRELAVVKAVDVAMVYSDFECELLAVEVPETPAVLFPLVHDPIPQRRALALREGVCFVGGYRHTPNVDAIRWFVDEVWPLVRKRCPSQTLYVAGSHMPPEVEALADKSGVQVVGFVEDIAEFLAARRVNVAPLRYGAGVKGKVAQSLAHGVPTVCTAVAAEGMQLSIGANVLVGETPAELADRLVELLTDDQRWHAVSDAGLAYAAEVTSRASAERRVVSMLELIDGL